MAIYVIFKTFIIVEQIKVLQFKPKQCQSERMNHVTTNAQVLFFFFFNLSARTFGNMFQHLFPLCPQKDQLCITGSFYMINVLQKCPNKRTTCSPPNYGLFGVIVSSSTRDRAHPCRPFPFSHPVAEFKVHREVRAVIMSHIHYSDTASLQSYM